MARRNRNEVNREYWTDGEGLLEVKKWIEAGVFDKDIAANIGISRKTLIEWKKKYELFRAVFDISRKISVLKVVNAMYKAALGGHITEQVLDASGKKRVVRKYLPPNVAAGIFLTKNWNKEEYRDKWDVEVTGELPVVLTGDDEVAD